ncbi:MAG: ABC transporter substrate-binding protein [Rhodospirillales bacterium]|nr:ABC transporter substrate-binding protein [Rhodospirillales bacterium]
MLKRFALTGALVICVVGMGFATSARADANEENSLQFIQSVADKAIQSLTAKDTPKPERVKQFRILFNENFAVKSIGKFVLGRYWGRASEAEQNEYLGLFEDLMVVSYVDRFSSYAGESLVLKDARTENETTITVFSEIKRPGGTKPIQINWRVGTNGTIYKILDVAVEGASMSTTLKSDFGSIVRQKDGKVSGLIDELKKKTASLTEEMQK